MLFSILAFSLATDTQDYDMNGKHVTYYPEALMISHNPQAVVFYHDTTLFNLFVTLRTPSMGKDFTINDTCSKDESRFLSELLLQIRTVQRSMQRLLSSHGYTSLIECDSYLRRYYQYSTGLTATMNCPYGYRKSLKLCKIWALKHCSNISPHEKTWLHSAKRSRRSPPWACTAGLGGIPRYFYTAFGGSCDSGEVSGLIDILIEFATSVNTVHAMAKTIQGKTVYLAKITDKLVTKVNNLQSALRNVDKTLATWQTKLQQFATNENCHFNNFMEFLSKFSLEVTRSFSTLLRFTEIHDILHQAHKLHEQQIIGLQDLPSFLASEFQLRLKQISSLSSTADALDSGFPLLLQPMVDFTYRPSASIGVNMLFTIPKLDSAFSFCTIEYLTPLKYKIANQCYEGPVTRDELALLRCQQSAYLLHRNLLEKCFHSDMTFVCPRHILTLVNDTEWIGLPWHKHSKLTFSRRHQLAPDCSNLHDLLNLGGRYYLSTQQRLLTLYNSTNGSTHSLQLSPLTVYHFPCELTFATQTSGYGECPTRISLHVPLFTQTDFHYVPWLNENDNNILRLHYDSLNLSPPLHFDNKTIQSLDKTFTLLDGQFATQMTSLRHRISQLHTIHPTRLNDFLTYIAFALALINTVFIFLSHCGRFREKSRHYFQKRTVRHTRSKRPVSTSRHPSYNSITRSHLSLPDSDNEHSVLHTLDKADLQPTTSSCSTCNKPLKVIPSKKTL